MSIVKLNNQGVKNATAFGSITGLGSMVFIKKLTASSSSTLSFVDGSSDVVLDNTYKEYVFTFNNIHPATNNANFGFKASVDGGSSYGVATTTTMFRAVHTEDNSSAYVNYNTGEDAAQSTGLILLNAATGNGADNCDSGVMSLFNPSSTTFVKHFISSASTLQPIGEMAAYVGGYINSTSAVDAIQFSYHSGNIDAGDICLYGIA